MTENQTTNVSEKKHRVGTIEGTALILGVLLLIVVFYHILPELRQFHNYITRDTQELQEAVVALQLEQSRLAKQICTSNFDREIGELNTVLFLLKDLEAKSDTPVREQIQVTNQEVEKLLNLLKADKTK